MGDEKPSGPDLLLSYHENNHYNSVRDESVSRSYNHIRKHKPAEAKCNSIQIKPNMEIDNAKGNNCSTSKKTEEKQSPESEIKQGTNKIKSSQNKARQKRNDLCSCGSGLRYKKCCLAASKEKERLAKWKEKHGSRFSEGIESNVAETHDDRTMLEGGFCVLKI